MKNALTGQRLQTLGMLAALALSLGACGNGSSSVAAMAIPADVQGVFTAYTSAFQAPGTKAAIKTLSASSFTNLYTQLTGSAKNDAYQIGPYNFKDDLAMATSMRPQYEAIDKEYGNMHQYWARSGINETQMVTVNEYNQGLMLLEKSVNAFADHKDFQLSAAETGLVMKAKLVNIALIASGTGSASLSLWCIGCVVNNIHMDHTNVNAQAGLANGMVAGSGNGNGANNGNGNQIGANNGSNNEVGANNGNGNQVGANNGNGNEIGANNGNGNKIGTDNQIGSGNGSNNKFATDNCYGGTIMKNGLIQSGSDSSGCSPTE